MSIRKMAEVWERSQHSATHLLMLLAIADFADDDGRAYPSVASLARKCRMKPRNAQMIIAALRNSGELIIRVGEGPKGTNLYRIPPLQGIAPLQNSAPPAKDCTRGAKDCAKPLQGIAPEPSVNRQQHKAASPPSAPSNPKQVIFTLGVSILTSQGEKESKARSFLGKFAARGEAKLAEVIGYLAANPKVQAKAYIAGAFKPEERGLVL